MGKDEVPQVLDVVIERLPTVDVDAGAADRDGARRRRGARR